MTGSFASVRVVLVNTSHPGNIGAAARAMKNMGLERLYLVAPREFPAPRALWRAAGAVDVLERAVVVESLAEAVADCGLVVGTSSRHRHLPWDLVEPRECAQRVVTAAQVKPVAVLFGSERIGLTNDTLMRCNLLVTIPTDAAYSSLNVAMAVQLVAYELWMALRPGAPAPRERDVPLATADEMARLYQHIEEVLAEIDFRDRTGGGFLMARIRRLFNRAQVDQNELNILRGILTAVQSRRRIAGSKPDTGKSGSSP